MSRQMLWRAWGTYDEGIEEDCGDEVERRLDQAERRGDVAIVEVCAVGHIVALESVDYPDPVREDMLYSPPKSARSTRDVVIDRALLTHEMRTPKTPASERSVVAPEIALRLLRSTLNEVQKSAK